MRRRPSLRLRVALAFAGLGALSSLLFALGIWYVAHDVSQRLMDETLEAEMADYTARRARNPHSLPPATASLKGFLLLPGSSGTELPGNVLALPSGKHNITLEGVAYRVAIADNADARYVLLFDETRQQRREQRFLFWLFSGAALMTLLVTLGGHWLAGRVIAPVTDLAHAVSNADPANPPHLARDSDPGDEIDELARAFDHYFGRLAAFIQRERAFTADASHELRTPLAVIRGAAEVLADMPGLPAAERVRVARIERAAAEMGELTAALLLLAREENAPPEAPCHPAQIVSECIERYRGLAQERNTRWDIELDDTLRLAAPAPFFAIIAANLLHNAVAHARAGSITVRLDAQQFVVADTGQGIAPDDQARVFERHYRGAASEGAGIGLSLVKRICTRLGWDISLAGMTPQGTIATLCFNTPLTT